MFTECWIIHEGGHGKLSQSVIKAVETHRIITDNTSTEKGRQSGGVNIKLVAISSTDILEEVNNILWNIKLCCKENLHKICCLLKMHNLCKLSDHKKYLYIYKLLK